MTVRRVLVAAALCAGAALPVIIGASCPPPENPFYLAVTTNRLNVGAQIPPCTEGFVCISIVNTAYVPVDVSLYVHDGYDMNLTFCVSRPPPTVVWVTPVLNEYCPGFYLGEFQLAQPQLYTTARLHPIDGQNIRVFRDRESTQLRIPKNNIKTFGIAVARQGELAANGPEIQKGPHYRCTLVDLGFYYVPRAPEDVNDGCTLQYLIYDLNNGALPGLAQLAVQTAVGGGQTDKPCDCSTDKDSDEQ